MNHNGNVACEMGAMSYIPTGSILSFGYIWVILGRIYVAPIYFFDIMC